MRSAAAAALLLLLACAGAGRAAARPLLGGLLGVQPAPLACQGITPAAVDVGGLQAVGANGVIELSWQPVQCATSYALIVDREDIPPEQDNELSFNVTVTRAVVKNVANGSPYIVSIAPCNGQLCGTLVALRVTPSGQIPATMPVAGPGTPAASGAGAAMPAPTGFGTLLPGSQWRVVMRPAQA